MSLSNNTIWHLSHSSNAIKVANKLFIFDYHQPATKNPDLNKGQINPQEIKDEQVYVLISHGHPDHFNRGIFNWSKVVKNISYIISSDVHNIPDKAHSIKPNKSLKLGDVEIKTYPSTDIGVAFSVFVDNHHIYFAGDNAFWNWENKVPEKHYIKNVLDKIDSKKDISIAFQVCDPRLEGQGEGGIYAFARAFNPNILVPIHSFGNYSINQRAHQKLKNQGFKNKFWCINRPGDSYSF